MQILPLLPDSPFPFKASTVVGSLFWKVSENPSIVQSDSPLQEKCCHTLNDMSRSANTFAFVPKAAEGFGCLFVFY